VKSVWLIKNSGRLAVFAVTLGIGICFAGPFLFASLGSFKGAWEVLEYPPTLFPKVWHPENYALVFTAAPFLRWILNSVQLVALTVVGGVLSEILVAYAFARFRWPGRDIVFMLALSTMMLPREVTTIPSYIFFGKIGWLDTYLPFVVPAWLGGSSFMIFLFRQFFMSLPRDLDEAAFMDGATPLRVLWSVLLPLCRPVIATAAVISFIRVWSDFWHPFIYLHTYEKYTISLGLRIFTIEAPRTTGYGTPTVHLMLTATMIALAPCLVLFVAAQKYFVRSIVTSGLKGV
jgi:ABC-type glycerol-3-phosphate transport system permease component